MSTFALGFFPQMLPEGLLYSVPTSANTLQRKRSNRTSRIYFYHNRLLVRCFPNPGVNYVCIYLSHLFLYLYISIFLSSISVFVDLCMYPSIICHSSFMIEYLALLLWNSEKDKDSFKKLGVCITDFYKLHNKLHNK